MALLIAHVTFSRLKNQHKLCRCSGEELAITKKLVRFIFLGIERLTRFLSSGTERLPRVDVKNTSSLRLS